jgi:hypothetical protein
MDWSKMGPGARRPANEAMTKKEVQAFLAEEDKVAATGDMNQIAARADFPVFMMTDDLSGAIEAKAYGREEYIGMMKPFVDNMPKDTKTVHKYGVTVLSDALALVSDDYTMKMGKVVLKARNGGVLVKREGKWMWKSMVEAGWGGGDSMPAVAPSPAPAPAAPKAAAPAPSGKSPAAAGSAPAPAPAPAPAAAPAPAPKR